MAFGQQSLRISNAKTSGSFSGQTFRFLSATPSREQAGLAARVTRTLR